MTLRGKVLVLQKTNAGYFCEMGFYVKECSSGVGGGQMLRRLAITHGRIGIDFVRIIKRVILLSVLDEELRASLLAAMDSGQC